MKKTFLVAVDVTMAGNYYIEAESEAQAKSILMERFKNDPYGQAKKADCYVGHVVTDVNEV